MLIAKVSGKRCSQQTVLASVWCSFIWTFWLHPCFSNTSSRIFPEVEERLLWSQGSSYLTRTHRSSSQKPSTNAVAKHLESSFCVLRCECDQSLKYGGKLCIFWNHKHMPFLSQSLLSADLSCGWRIEVGKTPGAPVATCCFGRNTARLTTQPHHSWRFCESVLVCLFVCVLGRYEVSTLVFP